MCVACTGVPGVTHPLTLFAYWEYLLVRSVTLYTTFCKYMFRFFVMTWWVMLREVVSCILFSCFPYEVERVLLYSVLDLPVPHVESFGEFGSHVGCEYAVRRAVVGFEGRSVCGLRVS